MNISQILSTLKKNWIASAVLCILVGIVLVLFPSAALNALAYFLGGFAIASGVIRMVRYFQQDHTYPVIFQSDLIVGIFSIGLGLFMVTNPQTVMSAIPLLFGILLVGFGISNVLRSMDAKKAGIGHWALLLALAVISIVLGAVIMADPFATLEVAVIIIGAALIYEGVSDVIIVLSVGKRIQSWRNQA